jgi:hypothetical protein
MTGYEEHNFPAFTVSAQWLRQHGYEVVNPAELEALETGPRREWAYYLKRDIRELLTCDSVAVMHGWENSPGATLEVYIGWRLGFAIFKADDFTTVDVSCFDFSDIKNGNVGSFLKAFTPPKMTRTYNTGFGDVEWINSEKPKPENILKEADRIVGGDRAASYGHPKQDFERTAKIWSAILGFDVPAEKVALCMIGVKISRQCNAAKRDNWTDIAGYAQTGYMVDQKDGRME